MVIEIVSRPVVFPAVGRCIYCSTESADLRREHIIPFGLGGRAILPKSSCRACEAITGRTEQIALRGMLGKLRLRLGLPTRNKKDRPTTLPINFINPDGSTTTQYIPVSEYPQYLVTFQMPPPGILAGRPQETTITLEPRLINARHPGEDVPNWNESITVQPWAFLRMLAKIAHSFAIAELGWDQFSQFTPLLREVILETSSFVSHLVGGIGDADGKSQVLHWLNGYSIIHSEIEYLVVDISLFTLMKAPIFRIVVAQRMARIA